MDLHPLKIFCGNSNPELGSRISEYLDIQLSPCEIKRFSDGEVFVDIKESVRGADVFIVQSTCPPVNDNLVELCITIDAFKRASAKSITAVIPYYGYARQDRKVSPRVPISAKLVADLITTAGVSRVVSMELHAGQIQGLFNVPFDHLFASPVVIKYVKEKFKNRDLVIISPDAGGVERARAYAKRLNASLAIIDKRRTGMNEAKAMNIIGEVSGKDALILDDLIDTAGTLTEATTAALGLGATSVSACCTHPVFSGPAFARIESSPLTEVIVTDTIPLSEKFLQSKKIKLISVAPILGEAIKRIYSCDSVSTLFV
ncbi:MAG: ribose-phosphate pyrophosphokinase [Deltaproteobacteria bacterium]|nr:ribose-phosphate pyrophosphokinase [Deltaproteobacteria bacterium]